MKNIVVSVRPEDENNSLVTSVRSVAETINGFRRLDIDEHLIDHFKFVPEIHNFIMSCDFYLRVLSSKSLDFSYSHWYIKPYLKYHGKSISVINIVIDPDFKNAVKSKYPNFTFEGAWIDIYDNSSQKLDKLYELLSVTQKSSLIQFDVEERLIKNESIISVSNRVNQLLMNNIIANPKELKQIDRRVFEQFIAELFWGFGYEVELTKQTRDGGKDIIAVKNKEVKVKYLIECKRPDIGNPVGVQAVRELFGVKNDQKSTKAILATSSFFTADAKEFFDRNYWELEPRDYDGIIEWIDEYKNIKYSA